MNHRIMVVGAYADGSIQSRHEEPVDMMARRKGECGKATEALGTIPPTSTIHIAGCGNWPCGASSDITLRRNYCAEGVAPFASCPLIHSFSMRTDMRKIR